MEVEEQRGAASAVVLTIQICTVESNRMRGSEMRQQALLQCNRTLVKGGHCLGSAGVTDQGLGITQIVLRLTDISHKH